MPPKVAAGRPCEECDGSGEVVQTRRRECHNCDGTGACAAGRGNKFVCPLCNGEGHEVMRDRVKCPECKGAGRRISKGREEAPQVLGRSQEEAEKKAAVAPPAHTVRTSVGSGRGVSDEPQSEEEGDEEDPKPKKPQSQKKVPKEKATPKKDYEGAEVQEGIWWEPGVGLVIRTTLGPTSLMNGIGILIALIGLILLLADSPVAYVVGILFLITAISMLALANKDRCKKLLTRDSSDSK
ncbi:unnamed protein product [Durusdinium trenchii]|uniref:CR-type domain-containing protein n=1 Tax=Durusdinium trenchii TaxID=1381693 RepID=A0ABP0PF30_9DINO